MKLQKRREEDYRQKSKRPEETKHLPLERIARGIVEDSSAFLFKVSFSRKTLKKEYNPPKSEEELSENNYINERRKILLFRKEDCALGKYKNPNKNTSVRCIYHGNRNSLFPYEIFDMNWNLLWKEKNGV